LLAAWDDAEAASGALEAAIAAAALQKSAFH
jgi:hypothetical protein